jgi:hypothetical protein
VDIQRRAEGAPRDLRRRDDDRRQSGVVASETEALVKACADVDSVSWRVRRRRPSPTYRAGEQRRSRWASWLVLRGSYVEAKLKNEKWVVLSCSVEPSCSCTRRCVHSRLRLPAVLDMVDDGSLGRGGCAVPRGAAERSRAAELGRPRDA